MTGEPLDLEAIKAEFLVQCGSCDYGLVEYGCQCPKRDYRPDMLRLVNEIERLHAERKADIAEVVREVVELATAEISPEWVKLVKDVNDGLYTPPAVQP